MSSNFDSKIYCPGKSFCKVGGELLIKNRQTAVPMIMSPRLGKRIPVFWERSRYGVAGHPLRLSLNLVAPVKSTLVNLRCWTISGAFPTRIL